MLLATVVANKDANPGVDFLPLRVDYREKLYVVAILGNFFSKRNQTLLMMRFLTMRLVAESCLRPTFPR